jgi:hypothetical protein
MQLTIGHPLELEQAIKATFHAGQAHWAGWQCPVTGATCASCWHFEPDKKKPNQGVCHKRKQLLGKAGKPFPASALACKFYEASTAASNSI